MKKLLLIALSAVVAAVAVPLSGCNETNENEGISYLAGSELTGTKDGQIVKWEGRYEYKQGDGTDDNPDMVYIYHTATGFTVDFVGTELIVGFYAEINNAPYYNVAVDDEVLPNPSEDRTFSLAEGYQEITVVSGLEEGEHTVQCLKMSEPSDANTAIYFFETDGEFTYRDTEDDESNFRFMFVCASGGSGHGSLAIGNSGSYTGRTTANSSSLHAFNYLTARMFGADVQFVANSGWGVKYPKSVSEVMDYTGITKANTVAGAKKTALWDYDSWIPDVIIFNIGGNDTVSSGFNQAAYQAEVVAMIENLHEHYPNANMIWTHTGSNAGKYAMTAISDAGLTEYVKEVVIPAVGAGTTGSGTVGANNHNSIKTHIDTAEILAKSLNEFWGYTTIRDNISYEDFEDILQIF